MSVRIGNPRRTLNFGFLVGVLWCLACWAAVVYIGELLVK
jgi:hypothetical protein